MNGRNDIGWAVNNMRSGLRVRRAGWNGKGMFLALEPEHRKQCVASGGETVTVLPCAMMRTVTGEFVPWLCSQTDLLAYDWEVAE